MHSRRAGVDAALSPVPVTYLAHTGACLTLPSSETGGDGSNDSGLPWFLKGSYSGDNYCIGTFDECVKLTKDKCTKGAFVVQQHIARPLLVDGHKFDLRVHVAVVARKDAAGGGARAAQESVPPFQAFMFKTVAIKLTRDTWDPSQLESASQHTNMHFSGAVRLLSSIPHAEEILQSSAKAIEACLRTYRTTVHHCTYCDARSIFGVDVMIDEDRRAWVLEFNNTPGDDPSMVPAGIYEAAYIRIKKDLPVLASEPLLEGRRAQALEGWQELNF